MKYLAVLGRQPEISLAELEALCPDSRFQHHHNLAIFDAPDSFATKFSRLGGTIKLAVALHSAPLDFLKSLPDGKITLGVSDYSAKTSARSAVSEALKFKKILTRHGRSVRVVDGKTATLPTATSLHNGLSGKNERKVELIKYNDDWFRVVGIQDIDAYTRRDQARPARDAKVGMLPPKLAQILINLCGDLPANSTILDPFCGTGVVLQEAILMGYHAYGTDLSDRMIEYSTKNLEWLIESEKGLSKGVRSLARRGLAASARGDGPDERAPRETLFRIRQGDATSFRWQQPVSAVACECFLGRPMSIIPPEIKLKTEQQECTVIILGFLKNLAAQISSGTPVVIAIPAWLREDGSYSRLKILDFMNDLGYNVNNKSREGLIYCREGQIVARDIIILRKD